MIPQVEASLQSFVQEVFACTPDTATCIARRAFDRCYPASTVIIKQGDRSHATYLVAEGLAQALVNGRDGQNVLLHEYRRGDFFGAVAELDPEPEGADIVAIDDVRAAVFRLLDFLRLVEMHACVGRALTRILARQLRTASEKMAERTILSASGRVHAELLRLARRASDGRTIRPTPVLTNLAVHVQSTRETVSRTISALERRGIVRRDGDALVIVAPRLLEELVV